MRITDISENWEFKQHAAFTDYYRPCVIGLNWLPAKVPGCVHLDLLCNGVISDPFTSFHEHGCQWVDIADWVYRTSFVYESDESDGLYGLRKVLRFEGLDTIATIYLNGDEIGHSENMFIPLEIDVSESILGGKNELEIRFCSAVRVGMERRAACFERERLNPETTFFDERAFVRKAQYMSGWDWGPRLVSCGIWRPVRLIEFESRIRSYSVHHKRLDDGRFRVWSETGIEGEVPFLTTWDGKEFEGDFDLIVENPELWWPNGLGEPHLYEITARIEGQDSIQKKVGLRTIELKQEDDQWGRSFEFVVNGKPIFAIGGNWIPNDSFPSRINPNQVAKQVHDCAEYGMNMIRVWGGGLYESEEFYDACDEHGILVWQDFPFACSYYPDSKEFLDEIEREARFQIERLRDRTCLALWCGNNEIQTMWEGKWGKPEHQPDRWYGETIFKELFPKLIKELDPIRSYISTSPTGSDRAERPNCNSDNFGDQHFWEVWHGKGDWVHYRDSGARFCSEFGFASSCSMECWETVFQPDESTSPAHPVVRSHDKTNKPWEIFRGLVELHYPRPNSLDEWVETSQLNQRDAMREAFEHFRISRKCAGALVWQINDCWPAQSWSLQDYARIWKPAGLEMKRLCHPILVALRVYSGFVEVAVDVWHDDFPIEISLEFCSSSARQVLRSLLISFEMEEIESETWKRIDTTEFDRFRTIVSAQWTKSEITRTTRSLCEPKEMISRIEKD